MPIVKKETDTQDVMQAVDALHAAAQQAGIRCKVDASTEKTPGWKFNHYEMKVCTGLHSSDQINMPRALQYMPFTARQ